jgi:hypothetical protein
MDKRSKSEQVRSGFQIVGSLIIGFIVLVMLIGGFTLLSDQQGSKTVAWMALAVAATVLFCTANRWASIVGATLALPSSRF